MVLVWVDQEWETPATRLTGTHDHQGGRRTDYSREHRIPAQRTVVKVNSLRRCTNSVGQCCVAAATVIVAAVAAVAAKVSGNNNNNKYKNNEKKEETKVEKKKRKVNRKTINELWNKIGP